MSKGIRLPCSDSYVAGNVSGLRGGGGAGRGVDIPRIRFKAPMILLLTVSSGIYVAAHLECLCEG